MLGVPARRPRKPGGAIALLLAAAFLLSGGLPILSVPSAAVPSHGAAVPLPALAPVRGPAVRPVNSAPPHPAVAFYPVTFTQQNLPCCWSWTVTVSGQGSQGTNGGSTTFYLVNGSYSYGVADLVYYVPTPSSGSFTVAGAAIGFIITFNSPPTWPVQVNQTGLSASAAWTIKVHFDDVPGSSLFYNVSGANAVIYLRNDTYQLTLSGPAGYGALNGTGTLVVRDAMAYYDVAFHVGQYDVVFTEHGLPLGTSWTVIVGSGANSSTTSSITDFYNDGTYSYQVGIVPGYVATPRTGYAYVSGAGDFVPIAFAPATFVVNVSESGLANGTYWSAAINGSSQSTLQSYLLFQEPNGTFPYSVGGVGGYTLPTYSGELTVDGQEATMLFVWQTTLYSVGFVERGLPAGAQWSVDLVAPAGQFSNTTDSITLPLANGTYEYRIVGPSGFAPSTPNGTITVTGSDVQLTVNFSSTASGSWLTSDVVPGVSGGVLIGALAVVAVAGGLGALWLRRKRG